MSMYVYNNNFSRLYVIFANAREVCSKKKISYFTKS